MFEQRETKEQRQTQKYNLFIEFFLCSGEVWMLKRSEQMSKYCSHSLITAEKTKKKNMMSLLKLLQMRKTETNV